MALKKTFFYLGEEQLSRLAQESQSTGISVSEIVRRLLSRHYNIPVPVKDRPVGKRRTLKEEETLPDE